MAPAILTALNPPPDSWEAIMEEYELYEYSRGFAIRTIEGRRDLLRRFGKFAKKSPADVTVRDLRQYLARDVSLGTKSVDRANLQVFFRWMLREEYIVKNPAEFLDPIRKPRRKPRPFTPDQLIAILEAANRRKTRTMVVLGAFQGWRASEIARVRGDQFDLHEGIVRWIGKGSVEREAPIHPIVAAEVNRYPTGHWFLARSTNEKHPHIHPRSVSDLLTRCIRRAGIDDPRLTGHSLRHTFATELVKAGVDIRIISEMLGHANLATTAIYTQVMDSQQADAIRKIGLQLPANLAYPPRRPHRRVHPETEA